MERDASLKTTVIIVLGAPNDDQGALSSIARERCRQALWEYRNRQGSKILPTGGWGKHFNTTAKPHGHYLREYLKAQGIPDDDFVECAESSNTIEDATFCRLIVERHGFQKLVVVTSDFHLRRAQFLFTRQFPDIPVEFSAAKTSLPDSELQSRIAHERNALVRLQSVFQKS